jgi:glyoxylase-like metal-dependent hydrolase (beta-lactamase superfamily II)
MPEVSAKTLNQPLSGGSPGAHVTLRPFSTGEMAPPRGWTHKEEDGGPAQNGWAPCPIFLVEHPTAGHVLIDTGLPAAAAHDQKAAFGRSAAAIVKVRVDPAQPLPARLRELDLKPADIKTVVMTHLHLDHAGSIHELPGATFVLAEAEWKAANSARALLQGYVKRQFNFGFDYRMIDYDARDVKSFASFGRSFDLFGDGTIQLVSTPGHTAGHQSVVVRLRDREALICGDAAYMRRTIDESFLPRRMQDEHKFKRSLREIRAYAQMTPSALLIPGHDAEAFGRLEPFYG